MLALAFAVAAMLSIGMVLASAFRSNKIAIAVGTVLFFALQFFAGLWILGRRAGVAAGISDGTPSAGQMDAADRGAIDGGWPASCTWGSSRRGRSSSQRCRCGSSDGNELDDVGAPGVAGSAHAWAATHPER